MYAYAYKAALFCSDCTDIIKKDLDQKFQKSGAIPGLLINDSERYPQGPYANGGGEADCPQHCERCYKFLENPQTKDGIAFTMEALAQYVSIDDDDFDIDLVIGRLKEDIDFVGEGGPKVPGTLHVLLQWAEFYKEELR